jgi:ABC-type branched-subunit amino acid transport system substrate-binding protein
MSGLAGVSAAALLLSACGSTAAKSAGSAATPGYDAATKTFNVVAIEPTSGPIGVAGQALVAGMKVYFDALNAKGGIDGKYKVKFDSEDSQYNTQAAVPIYNRIKGSTAIISGILGTDILNALKPHFEADKLSAIIDSSSATLVHDTYFIPWSVPAQIHAVNLVSYAANKLGMKDATYCSMTSPDDNGEDNRQGIQFAVKQLGLKFGIDVQPPAGTTDFTPQVKKLQSAGCGVVEFGMTTGQLTGTVSAAAQLNYTPQWLGMNNTYTPAFAQSPIAPYLEKHYLTALIGVPWDSSVQGMSDLRAAVAKYSPKTPPSAYTELGYAHAALVEAILSKAVANKDFTREGILKAGQEVGSFDADGLLPAYDYAEPSKRKPPLVTSIYKIDPSGSMGLAVAAENYSDPSTAKFPIP